MKAVDVVKGWFKRFARRPAIIAAVLAGLMVVFGVPEPLAKQVGSTVGAVVGAIERQQAAPVVSDQSDDKQQQVSE